MRKLKREASLCLKRSEPFRRARVSFSTQLGLQSRESDGPVGPVGHATADLNLNSNVPTDRPNDVAPWVLDRRNVEVESSIANAICEDSG